jgi:hypothetical protein
MSFSTVQEQRFKEAESYIGKVLRTRGHGQLVETYIIVTDVKQKDYMMISSSVSERDKIFQDNVTISYVDLTSGEISKTEECPFSYLKYSFVPI